MITKSLFYYCKKVFILINKWIIGKKLMKHHYLKKKDFSSHLNMEDINDPNYAHAKKI